MHTALRVLQITDLHLKAKADALWRGHNVQNSLNAVLELACDDAHWPPDLILVTGDIVDDETPEGYHQTYHRLFQQLKDLLADSATTIAYIPGNHDDAGILAQSCAALGIQGCGDFVLGNWLVIQLDSTIPHNCEGELGSEQLCFLKQSLQRSTQPNILITLHHPLVKLGSAWLDSMRVKDADAFFAQIKDFNSVSHKTGKSVKAVVWGHAHQQTDIQTDGIRLLGTPAAGPVQFTVGSNDFAIDERLSPGLRWLTLKPDGRIETRVERVKNIN